MLSLSQLKSALPICFEQYIIRPLVRSDIDHYANWPSYNGYREMFNSSLKNKPLNERDKRWHKYQSNNTMVPLVLESSDEKTLGRFVLLDIDWTNRCIGNMSIRLHPDYCDLGIGSKALSQIVDFLWVQGFKKIEFDVLATNIGAIKSYKKAGFEITKAFNKHGDLFYMMTLMSKSLTFKDTVNTPIETF